jgi:ACS family sodium-dependent inorganic phosphate cotransporter
MIAEKYSAKWVIWASVLVNVVFTILTPLASNISYIAVLVVRFIEGLGAVRFPYSFYYYCQNVLKFFKIYFCVQGVSLPAIHVMLTKWVLTEERNLMSSLAYAGKYLIIILRNALYQIQFMI